jgi:excinuclease ABC subunit C
MAENSEKIKQKLALLPAKPGVYLMKNSQDKVIYVGKAKVLKNRVRSYFTTGSLDRKTSKLVKNITDLDYIITSSEQSALVLENNLIKKYKPRYNIYLRDDKQYPFIKVTTNEDFPRIIKTRRLVKDGSRYFGPYTDGRALNRTLRTMEWIFALRTCKREIVAGGKLYKRACMNYQMGLCPAPCIGKISKKEYRQVVNNAIRFLKGKNQEVIEDLKQQMQELAASYQYEKAAEVRDKISNIQKLNRSSSLFFSDLKDRDVIGLYKEENKAAVAILKILGGKLLNKQIYPLDNIKDSGLPEIMEAFLTQYYAEKLDNLPYQIIVQVEPHNFADLNEILRKKLHVPQRGENRLILKIARENAFNYVEEQKLKHLRKSNRTIFPVKELKDKLQLSKLPRKMICVDISTIQGSDTVSSVVYFQNGKPKKKNYRHFIMKTVQGQDDFASMIETLQRYFNKLEEADRPDLIVIDGGKGQLSSAYKVVKAQNWQVELISLAKRIEEVFVPGQKDSIILPRNSAALRLLVHIRDEAHRFAITFHRKRRKTRTLTSQLDQIKGVGEHTKFILLKEFGSIENIKKADVKELMKTKGIGEKTAKLIKENLK